MRPVRLKIETLLIAPEERIPSKKVSLGLERHSSQKGSEMDPVSWNDSRGGVCRVGLRSADVLLWLLSEGLVPDRRCSTDFNNVTLCQSRIICVGSFFVWRAGVEERVGTLKFREIGRDSASFSDGYQ